MSEDRLQNPANVPNLQAAEVIQYFLLNGRVPDDPAGSIKNDAALLDVITQLESIQQFALALANGDLEPELKLKGRVIGALKSLQANLRHLTWQAQRIASGDLNQKVHFMGDFASAFNRMVENLSQSQQALEDHAKELSEGRQEALNLMADAQAARLEAEAAFARLNAQMAEINLLKEQLQEQAIRDPLTTCYNRRYLEETLGREFARAQREAYSLSMLMIDIDHFKLVNDNFGHQAGDAVLRALGKLLQNCIRAGDIVCRYGGEEFLMVLPFMNQEAALVRSDFCRKRFEELEVVYMGTKISNTISVGFASYPLHGHTSEQIIQAADEGLYLAKNAGRNRVGTPKHSF